MESEVGELYVEYSNVVRTVHKCVRIQIHEPERTNTSMHKYTNIRTRIHLSPNALYMNLPTLTSQ